MKKKLFLTSILALAATLSITSCDSKNSNSEQGSAQSGSSENSNLVFTDFDNINVDELKEVNLSLRDYASINNAYSNISFTNVKNNHEEKHKYLYNGNMYEGEMSGESLYNLYSNDVLTIKTKSNYSGDYLSYFTGPSPISPSLPISAPVKEVLKGLAKISYGQFITGSRETDTTIASTKNYTFTENNFYYNDELVNDYKNVNSSATDLEDVFYNRVYLGSLGLNNDENSTKVYAIDDVNFVIITDSTYNNYFYSDIYDASTYSEKEIKVYYDDHSYSKLFVTKLEKKFQINYFEYSSNTYSEYVSDVSDDYVEKLGEKELVHSAFDSFVFNYDSAEYTNKANFINSFKEKFDVENAHTYRHELTYTNEEITNVALVDNSYSSNPYDLLDNSSNSKTIDVQYMLYNGSIYSLNVGAYVSKLNDKVLKDEALGENESLYTTTYYDEAFKIDLSDFEEICKDAVNVYDYDNVSYIEIESYKTYYIFVTVKVSYTNGEVSFETSNVEIMEGTNNNYKSLA